MSRSVTGFPVFEETISGHSIRDFQGVFATKPVATPLFREFLLWGTTH